MSKDILKDPGWYPMPALKEDAAKKVEQHYISKGYHTRMKEEADGRWTVLYRKKA
ncbi:hypothetical protein BN871_EA_00140 [Paenibacillus sp. P22]|nr:hypothetical protein BN871_EA_00140 [Paenibacillus sp. P22]